MNIQTNVMANMMREEDIQRISRHIKSKLFKSFFQSMLRDLVELVQRHVRTLPAERDSASLNSKNSFVEISLRIRKLPIDRPRPRDICNIATVFSTSVDQDNLALFQDIIITDIMNTECILAPCNNWDISCGVTATNLELVI